MINFIMQHKTQHYINVDSLPNINPLAEEKLMLCLKKEGEMYTANIKPKPFYKHLQNAD